MGEPAKVLDFKKKPSFMDAVKKTAKTTTLAKGKSKMQTLSPPDEVKEAVDKFIAAKQTEKTAKAQMDASETVINTWVRPVQDEGGIKGNYQKSYVIPGTNGDAVKYITQNKFSINADDLPSIEQILGDKFADLIDQSFSVKLKDEFFTDESLQEELMEMVGERFNDFFETTTKASVKENFDSRIFQAVEPEQLPELRLFCRQYKASLR